MDDVHGIAGPDEVAAALRQETARDGVLDARGTFSTRPEANARLSAPSVLRGGLDLTDAARGRVSQPCRATHRRLVLDLLGLVRCVPLHQRRRHGEKPSRLVAG